MKNRARSFARFVAVAVAAGGAIGVAHAGPVPTGITTVTPKPIGPIPTTTLPNGLKPPAGLPPQTITLPTNLAPPHTRASRPPVLASDGDDVYALIGSLPDWGLPNYPITVARSTDGGATFAAPSVVASPAPYTTRPGAIAAHGGVVVATWVQDASVYYVMSTNRGATFSSPMRLADGVAVDGTGLPLVELAFSSMGPVAVWQKGSPALTMKDTTARVMFARLTAIGPTAQIQISREPFPATHPKVGTDGSRIVVAFAEDQDPLYLLSIAQSSDDGKTWDHLANAAEGNPGLTTLTDSERALLRYPTSGISKPVYRTFNANVEHVYAFGAATIVTVGPQGQDPATRAIVAADPTVGLFHGRSASLQRCGDAAVAEPQPLAQRGDPIFDQYERTPWLFARTSSGISSVWAQGYKSTAQFRSRLYTGRFTGAAALTDCHMIGENVDFRPSLFDANGDALVVAGGTAVDAAYGTFGPGSSSASLRHLAATTLYLRAASTPRSVAFAWVDHPTTDTTGAPKAVSGAR